MRPIRIWTISLTSLACAGLLASGMAVAIAPVAQAASATFTVTTTADSGAGSLRQAITDANLTADDDTIVFSLPNPSTITLASSLPQITKPLTISGPGESHLTIDAGGTNRVFFINAGNTVITDLTLTGSTSTDSNYGALIHNTKATSTIRNVTITNNSGRRLVYNKEGGSYLTIDRSTFSNNLNYSVHNDHGGVSNNVITITFSSFTNNAYAIFSYRRILVSDSTFTGNQQALYATGPGHQEFIDNTVTSNSNGVLINPSTANADSATITGNMFSSNAGYGLSTSVTAPATATITGNTFSGNTPDLNYNGSSTVPAGIAATNTFMGGPTPTISSANMSFGPTTVGTTSAASSITFSNTGGSSLTINGGGITITGVDNADYAVTGGTCVAGATITAGGSCTIDLAFAPTRAGARSATLDVATSAGSVSATLSGTGVSAPPKPAPAVPASAPLDVVAAGGDASAAMTWAAPATIGSFPITHYQVTTQPGGGACLVSAESTACTLEGLSNGTEYEVKVRALTGAGWGAWSAAVSVTPMATTKVVLTGSRTGSMVQVVGEVSGMQSGSVSVWVRLPGQARYSVAKRIQVTRSKQDVTWERRTNKRVYVFLQAVTDDGERTRSNRVVIPR